jgi:hypothetical protein
MDIIVMPLEDLRQVVRDILEDMVGIKVVTMEEEEAEVPEEQEPMLDLLMDMVGEELEFNLQ